MTRRASSSIVASPVLVGAVTVLVSIVAVFLAYNANAGLPFVPTYDVKAQLPSGAKLVRGNEVRLGGFRVGVVEDIRSQAARIGGENRAIAILDLKLDKVVEPLPKDTTVAVRPRSALGLKYIELDPGTSREKLVAGSTIGDLSKLRGEELEGPLELDDLFSTFDERTRANVRTNLEGFGDAFAGRGLSLNQALDDLLPFVTHLTPVMRNLADPDTELDEFFRQIGRASAQVAPVARVQAQLFSDMADTFAAFSASPTALRQTIEKAPPTLDAAISSFPVQRPFLAEFAELSRRLRPAARELPRSLPGVNRALVAGQPVLRQSVDLNQRTERVLRALDRLAENPNTLAAIDDLNSLTKVTRPLVEFLSPYQTVCNYWNYFWGPLGTHLSYGVTGGTYQRVLSMGANNRTQDNRQDAAGADRPADVPTDKDPQKDKDPMGEDLQRAMGPAYQPAIDAAGNADCQSGQTGYLDGPLVRPDIRYKPANSGPDFEDRLSGGSSVIGLSDFPGLHGPTFTGVKNLKDVP